MDASTLAAAALAIATETSQPAAVEELLLERERLAMDREALRSFLVERHYIHVPGYAQYARDQQLRESEVPYRLEEIPNIPEAPPIVIDYTEMPVFDELEVPPGYAGAAHDGHGSRERSRSRRR